MTSPPRACRTELRRPLLPCLAVALVASAGCPAPPPVVVVDAPVLSATGPKALDAGVSSDPAPPAPSRVSTEAPAEDDAGVEEVEDAGAPGRVVLEVIRSSGGSVLTTTMVVTSTGRVSINGNQKVFWTGRVAPAHLEAFRQTLVQEHACAHQKRESSGMSEIEVTATLPGVRCTSHWANVGDLKGPVTLRFNAVLKAAQALESAACKNRCPDFSEGSPY
jgi:hypothetical protein